MAELNDSAGGYDWAWQKKARALQEKTEEARGDEAAAGDSSTDIKAALKLSMDNILMVRHTIWVLKSPVFVFYLYSSNNGPSFLSMLSKKLFDSEFYRGCRAVVLNKKASWTQHDFILALLGIVQTCVLGANRELGAGYSFES